MTRRRFSADRPQTAATVVLALALALTACGKKAASDASQGATGEVLPGSVSDAMLQTDRLRASAPLDPRSGAAPGDKTASDKGKPGKSAPTADADGGDASTTTTPSPAPSAAPQAKAAPKSGPGVDPNDGE
ncbi:hypothetical protein ACFO0A_01715 [Novosphingobium tardum]|uniref:Lipoprotein n=1 Tax=Novosphingobium tardum TaxID=1538021 RepID=A0ABV8RKJ2_9SPHN